MEHPVANRWPIVCPSSPQERTIPPGASSPSESSGKLWASEDRCRRRRRQVSPHTPRRVRVGVRAHQVLRIHLGRGPRAPEQACAHPLVHFCDAGHFWSVFGHRRDPWQHSRPHRASSAWPRAAISGAAATSVACFEQVLRIALQRACGEAREQSRRELASPWPLSRARRRHPPPRSTSFEPAPGPARPAGHPALSPQEQTRATAASRRPPCPRSHEPAARRRPAGVRRAARHQPAGAAQANRRVLQRSC